jgi:hypothetical protein
MFVSLIGAYSFLGNYRNSGKNYPLWIREVTSKFVPVEGSEPFEVSSAAVTNSVLDGLKFLTENEYKDAEKDLAKWKKNGGTTTTSTSRGKRACTTKKPASTMNLISEESRSSSNSNSSDEPSETDDFDLEKETEKEERRAAHLARKLEKKELKRKQTQERKQLRLREKAAKNERRQSEKAAKKLKKQQEKAEKLTKEAEELAAAAEEKKRKAEAELKYRREAEELKRRKFDHERQLDVPEEIEGMTVETKQEESRLNRQSWHTNNSNNRHYNNPPTYTNQPSPRASSNVGANSFPNQLSSPSGSETFAKFQANMYKLERDQEMEKRHKCERDALMNEFSHNF